MKRIILAGLYVALVGCGAPTMNAEGEQPVHPVNYANVGAGSVVLSMRYVGGVLLSERSGVFLGHAIVATAVVIDDKSDYQLDYESDTELGTD